MLPGVYQATKKNGCIYYRSSIHFHNKHISLGSFDTEELAGLAYQEASFLLSDPTVSIYNLDSFSTTVLSHEKTIVLLNFRDNNIYFKNPIYLHKGYFSYFLTPSLELKFDIDDLFYYSSHKIQKRQGHLFVSDYGMQYSILARYGIKPYAVVGRDYEFVNGDTLDFRYSNIIIHNHFHGVLMVYENGAPRFRTQIHINGNYQIGIYDTEEYAAIAYNKAADFAKAAGITKNFPENYIDTFSPQEYAEIYSSIKISKRYLQYLETVSRK